MKRILGLGLLLALFAWAVACDRNEIPPTGPEDGRLLHPPQLKNEIEDPPQGGGGSGGSGGQGGGQWNFVWRDGHLLKERWYIYTSAATELEDFADNSYKWRVGFGNDVCAPDMPHLIFKDSRAEIVTLAKAIQWYCDTLSTDLYNVYQGDTVTYYDEAWHAIRNMMLDWHATSIDLNDVYGADSCDTAPLCNDAWLGMARNLPAYVIAADYLLSIMGDGLNRGYRSDSNQRYAEADSMLDNLETADSLATFIKLFLQEDPAVDASNDNTCANRDEALGDMAEKIPDNKGAAALACYSILAHMTENMEETNNDLIPNRSGSGPWADGSTYITSAEDWLKGWAGDTTAHQFARSKFTNGGSLDDTWAQGEETAIPLRNSGCVTWDCTAGAPAQNCGGSVDCRWGHNAVNITSLEGAPVEDVRRGGWPSEQCDPTGSLCADGPLLLNTATGHIEGTVAYLAVALEAFKFSGTDLYGHNGSRFREMVEWYDDVADAYDDYCSSNPPSGTPYCDASDHPEWTFIREHDNGWVASYIFDERGAAITKGQTNRGTGRMIDFTDLTHP